MSEQQQQQNVVLIKVRGNEIVNVSATIPGEVLIAEEGADFLDVYKMLLARGNDEKSAYQTRWLR